MACGCENLAITKRHGSKFLEAQRVMEKAMLGINRKDKKRKDWVRK